MKFEAINVTDHAYNRYVERISGKRVHVDEILQSIYRGKKIEPHDGLGIVLARGSHHIYVRNGDVVFVLVAMPRPREFNLVTVLSIEQAKRSALDFKRLNAPLSTKTAAYARDKTKAAIRKARARQANGAKVA